ncbi:uncharacterized protein N7515_005289 [Penicillium bovifimosum]|uniref:Uncharacterized protein n=1 Tax=Penicillium bovifimosum TaxID=126998 RepID=A0A9W9GSH0_9EURO|nr:uncharacterized protein N7515_005289 [Penicillium bovifimosum]KAJ5129250.1 hypothetical protein N7515_005289 [Penicillium bovifimosum]
MTKLFQPSVFQTPEGKNFADPHSNRRDYYWVTVFLPEHMVPRHFTDEEIMDYVLKQIQQNRCSVNGRAMYGLGKRCISLPIKRDEEEAPLPDFSEPGPAHPDLLLAVDLAAYWHEMILTKKIILDKDLIFVAKRGKAARMEDMLDVGLHVMERNQVVLA